MKRIFIMSAVVLSIGISCTKEIEESPLTLEEQTLMNKLVGDVHGKYDQDSFLICIDGDITAITSSGEYGNISFSPVFKNTDSQAARRHNLHRWYKVTINDEVKAADVAKDMASLEAVRKIQYNRTVEQVKSKMIPLDEVMDMNENRIKTMNVPTAIFNDPFLPQQWNLYNDGSISSTAVPGADIGVADAWRICTGSPEVTVAIIDSGISTINQDIRGNLWVNQKEKDGKTGVDDDGNGYIDDKYGYNFIKDSGSIDASVEGEGAPGHGTHVAGIIAAESNNGRGISGIAGGTGNDDGVRLMSCQIFLGSTNPTIETIAQALQYAADNGAAVASCSFGSPAGDSFYYDSDNLYKAEAGIEYDAIQYFIDPMNANCDAVGGNILVFSTGNHGYNVAGYPGALKDIIGVSAFGPDLLPTAYTNYGPGTNISAPGGDYYSVPGSPSTKTMILSTIPNGLKGTLPHSDSGEYGYMQGTSQACPHVTGVVALGMCYALESGKHFTREQFISMLFSSTNDMNSLMKGSKESREADGSYRTLNLADYYGNMGTGAVDAWKFLMQIEGTPSILTKAGETLKIDLEDYMGAHASDLTYLGIDIDDATAASLGINEAATIDKGILSVKCMNTGAGKIRVRAIAGGDKLGGGDSIGGMEYSKEISIVSRAYATGNGGWL